MGKPIIELEKIQRLATDTDKKILLQELDESCRTLTRLVASSSESQETKSKLARLIVFMLNILDIETERLNFDAIRKTKKGTVA